MRRALGLTRSFSRSASSLAQPAGKSLVEVEVKFRYRPEQEVDIARIAEFVAEKRFEDVYYDARPTYPLSGNDVWLRSRSGQFECKVPHRRQTMAALSGDEENRAAYAEDGHPDRYEELTREIDIRQFLIEYPRLKQSARDVLASLTEEGKPRMEDVLAEMGLEPFCRIETRRRKYATPDGLTIDLDSMHEMDYHIGEVELVVPPDQVQRASARIVEFATRHGLDVAKPIHGKVLWYIARHNPDQQAVLEATGLLARKLGARRPRLDTAGSQAAGERV